MSERDVRDLRVALQEAAGRHRPDRDAMLARVMLRVPPGPPALMRRDPPPGPGFTRPEPAVMGRGQPPRAALTRRGRLPRFGLIRLRPLGAATAVGVLLVLSIAGIRLAGSDGGSGNGIGRGGAGPGGQVAAPAPLATAPKPKPSTSKPPKAPASSEATHDPPGTDDSFLSSGGAIDPHSNPGWSQGNVTLRTSRTITALRVTVSVARTAGVKSTGQWSTVPPDLLTSDVSERAGRLVYRFVLKKGAELSPGTYTFAVQYEHAAGNRSPAADTYAVTATGGRSDAEVAGGFAAS